MYFGPILNQIVQKLLQIGWKIDKNVHSEKSHEMSSQGLAWPKCQSFIGMFRCIKKQNVNKCFPNFTSCSFIAMMLYPTGTPKNAITQLPAKVLAAGNSNAFLFDLTRAYLYTIWKTLDIIYAVWNSEICWGHTA